MSEEELEKLADKMQNELNDLMRNRLCYKDYMIYLKMVYNIRKLIVVLIQKSIYSAYQKSRG